MRRRVERKPDTSQAVRGDKQIIVRYIAIVVPNESAVPGRPIHEKRERAQRNREQTDTKGRAGSFVDLCHAKEFEC